MSELLGQTVGEYRLVEFLGAGGMGAVYRGEHSKIGRVVAIKVLTRVEAQPDLAMRFVNEARIQAGVQHRHIVALYDFVEHRGRQCIIMEYVDGEMLDRRLERSKGLPLAEALRLFRQVVEAVGHLHKHRIVHRDIKSSNIKIDRTGAAKLLDFGIARDARSGKVTMVGSYVGTLYYAAPEVLSGAKADVRSDVWALGVLFYEMLCGRMPYEADNVGGFVRAIARPSYPRPSKLNASCTVEAERLIDRCLQQEPGARYASGTELLEAMARLETGHVRAKGWERFPVQQWASLARAYWPILAVGVLGVALVVWLTWPSDPGPVRSSVPAPEAKRASESGPKTDAARRVVSIKTIDPDKAEILEEGRVIGYTPFQGRLSLGRSYAWTLRAEGYEDEPFQFIVRETENVYSSVLKKKARKP